LRKSVGKRPQEKLPNGPMQLRSVLKASPVTDPPSLSAPSNDEMAAGLMHFFQRVARTVTSNFGAGPTLPPVPVLLVDDMVDSRWTLTVAAVLLRRHGSGPVYPFALAKASPRGS